MRQAAAIAAALALLAGALAAVLSARDPRLAATNSRVVFSAVALRVKPGTQRCSVSSYIPKGASSVVVFAGTDGRPGPPLRVEVFWGRARVSSGAVRGGYRSGPLRIALRPLRRDAFAAWVCMRNLGGSRVRFAGNATPQSPYASQGTGGDVIRYDFYRSGPETWWAVAPAVAERFARVKPSWVGEWTLWVVLGAALLVGAGASVLVRRETRCGV
ncbi:MAG TPA: hypothetical protein VNB64_08370 [Solirubrobacteraceae bacterium]|nr:hypothetical protein [Solirubrobacteraceae bacterium]